MLKRDVTLICGILLIRTSKLLLLEPLIGANSAEWNNPLDRISNFCPSPSSPLQQIRSQKTPLERARNRIGSSAVPPGPNRGRLQNLLANPPVTYERVDAHSVSAAISVTSVDVSRNLAHKRMRQHVSHWLGPGLQTISAHISLSGAPLISL